MKWLDVALIAVLILSVVPMPALNDRAQAMTVQDQAPASEEAAPVEAPAAEEFGQIESILREEEDMVQGAISYDAGNRRDPFISLVAARKGPGGPGPRSGECPTGCLIDEITLTGIFVMPEGPVAQILSPDQDKSYLIRVGDEFHDGDVVAITADSVRFRQMVSDITQVKPFREVEKKLNP